MTKEDWEKVRNAWESPYAIRLKVDGYKVELFMVHHKMKMRRDVFIDDYFKFEWCCKQKDGSYPDEGKRFYQTKTKSVYSAKEIKEHQKIFGKRAANQMKAKKFEHKSSCWISFNSFKKHLITNNENIELIEC